MHTLFQKYAIYKGCSNHAVLLVYVPEDDLIGGMLQARTTYNSNCQLALSYHSPHIHSHKWNH